jgi:hypothetical protein
MRKCRRSAFDKWNISVVTVTQIFHSSQPSHGGYRSIFEVMSPPLPNGTLVSWLTAMEYLCHSDHRYVPLIESTSPAFPHSRLIIGFVTRLTRRVPLVDQYLQTILEHLSSTRSLVGLVLPDLYLYIYVL